MTNGFVVVITGIPSSGKTTLAGRLAVYLRNAGFRVEVLDGYFIRRMVLSYSDTDFEPGVTGRILGCLGWIARLLARNGVVVIVSGVFPSMESRRRLYELLDGIDRVVVYLKCRVEVCSKRDNKGLYKRFFNGELRVLPGINPPYEEPVNPDIVIDAEKTPLGEAVRIVVDYLKMRGFI